jgi:UPF0755 protein
MTLIKSKEFYNDLTMASPYNTYMNTGLLRPSAMPDITALEAVINPERTTLFISVPV